MIIIQAQEAQRFPFRFILFTIVVSPTFGEEMFLKKCLNQLMIYIYIINNIYIYKERERERERENREILILLFTINILELYFQYGFIEHFLRLSLPIIRY